jgi:hypothetical protein
MTKVILGYRVMPELTAEEYDRWLYDIHVPDLLLNPYLRKIVFNTVAATTRGDLDLYRISELHYDDMAGYEKARAWSEANPVPEERGPTGRSDFVFTVACDVVEIDAPTRETAATSTGA